MRNKKEHLMIVRGMGLVALVWLAAGAALASGNIDEVSKFAWAENAGWQNWRPTYGGVTVVRNGASSYLSGYVWGENIGWMKLGATGAGPYSNTSAANYGVNMDDAGKLSGFAWSETCGWINFSNAYTQVVIGRNGSFDGLAWAENIGYIHLANASPAYNVRYNPPGGTVIYVQ